MDWALREETPGGAWIGLAGPCTVAAALRSHGTWSLDGPAVDFDASEWLFRARFDAPAGMAEPVLHAGGIASIASLELNGEPLIQCSNMFVADEVPLAGRLRERGNELLIRCLPLARALEARRPRPKWRAPMVPHQQLRWHRTTLLGRTPGWSPPAAPVGPWRGLALRDANCVRREQVRLDAKVSGQGGEVRCAVRDAPHARLVELCLARDGKTWRTTLARDGASFRGGLVIDGVELWWPHTHGRPALYEAWLLADGERVDLAPVGFRTVDVDTSDSFEIRVNGIPVFCRGAVWMPLDPVSLQSPVAALRAAVGQSCRAGMNMLRIPGTTVYEEDAFYEACDAAGMLVWQDFMFANMDYPADDAAFAATVKTEVRQQLSRLAPHPCIAVLCGNSEVEQQAAMWGAPRDAWAPPLFHQTIPALCAELAPGTAYWPSSAHGGAFPHQADAGTCSYYGVGAYLRPPADARHSAPRFATECLAFANVPEDDALARIPGGAARQVHSPAWKARSPRDLGAGWDFDDVRDHYMAGMFGVDPAKARREDPDRYLLLAKLASAETMAAAFSEWRRPASSCRGALVLMLRDLWAGAGWGLLDEAGAPKACFHAVQRVLQPVAVLLTDEAMNGLAIHLINETPEARELQLELGAWLGEAQVASASRACSLAPRSAVSLPAAALLDHFMDLNHACHFGPPPCDTIAATLRGPDGTVIGRAFHFPSGLPATTQADPGLEARAEVVDAHTARLTVSARRLAVGVHFRFPGAAADDEYFHVPPGGEASTLLRFAGGFGPGTVGAANGTGIVRVAIAPVAQAAQGQRA